jgi:phage gp36-like protein
MYLTIQDFDTSIYPEIRNAIARKSQLNINHQINFALSLIRSRLSARYDMAAEFLKTGEARNPLLLEYAMDIAIYNLYNSQEAIPDHRVKRYDDAIEFLKDVVSKKANLEGVPLIPTDDLNATQGSIRMGSNPKRYIPLY